MICALTIRNLKPGSFEQFREAFMKPLADGLPEGFVHFDMVRNSQDPNQVICFGFFNGTEEDLRAISQQLGYDNQMAAIAPFVESVGTDGLFDVIENRSA